MAILYDGNKVLFISESNEDDVVSFRDFLQREAGEELEFDFTEAQSVHFALLQLVMAYKKSYKCSYKFADDKKCFEKVLSGFDAGQENCA
jgi:hypothetical protein